MSNRKNATSASRWALAAVSALAMMVGPLTTSADATPIDEGGSVSDRDAQTKPLPLPNPAPVGVTVKSWKQANGDWILDHTDANPPWNIEQYVRGHDMVSVTYIAKNQTSRPLYKPCQFRDPALIRSTLWFFDGQQGNTGQSHDLAADSSATPFPTYPCAERLMPGESAELTSVFSVPVGAKYHRMHVSRDDAQTPEQTLIVPLRDQDRVPW